MLRLTVEVMFVQSGCTVYDELFSLVKVKL